MCIGRRLLLAGTRGSIRVSKDKRWLCAGRWWSLSVELFPDNEGVARWRSTSEVKLIDGDRTDFIANAPATALSMCESVCARWCVGGCCWWRLVRMRCLGIPAKRRRRRRCVRHHHSGVGQTVCLCVCVQVVRLQRALTTC